MTLNRDPDGCISDPSPGFLGNLSPFIRRHPYEGKQLFLDFWENERRRQQTPPGGSEWLLLTGVDEKTFSQDFLSLDCQQTDCPQWSSYDNVLGLLLIRMTISRTQEDAAALFHNRLIQALMEKGLDPNLLEYRNSATCRGTSGAKQADFAYSPRRRPRERSKYWPCVVLETAFSEASSKLKSDIRFWLNESEGDVEVVFTMETGSSIIGIDKWELCAGRAHRTQHVEIKKGNNNRIYVSGQPLVLEFGKLFLRAGDIPQESDIEFGEEQLKELASLIWETSSDEYSS